MANATTTTLVSAVRKKIVDKYHQDFVYDMPLLNDAMKHKIEGHAGVTCRFPSIAPFAPPTAVVAEGANPSVSAFYSSAVEVTLAKWGDAKGISRLAYLATIAKTTDQIISEQMLQAKRLIHSQIFKTLRWGGSVIRADGDTNYQTFAGASADSSTTNVFVSTSLINSDDRYIGGQCAFYTGSGQGQGRVIQAYTGATGTVVSTTISGVDDPYDGILGWDADEGTNGEKTWALVTSVKGTASADRLSTPLILLGTFYHNAKFHTPKIPGPMSHKLYISDYGRNDLLGADNTFQQAIQHYRGEHFDKPDRAFYHWFGVLIELMTEGMRSTATGGTADAAYAATGACHYYPLVGKEAFGVTEISLDSGDSPGALHFYQIFDRDSNNIEPAYYIFGWKARFAAAVPFCSRVINLACGNPQA